MYTTVIDWTDGTRTYDKCDRKSIAGYELDWAVTKVTVLFNK